MTFRCGWCRGVVHASALPISCVFCYRSWWWFIQVTDGRQMDDAQLELAPIEAKGEER